MTDAYQCDVCGTYSLGRPPVVIGVDFLHRVHGGGGVLDDGTHFDWEFENDEIELCLEHAKHIIKQVNEL